jgi:hypothetical protein
MPNKSWPSPSDVDLVLAKVRSDESFKALLLSDANAALHGIGIEVPSGLTVKIHENTSSCVNYILPPKSGATELSDAMLESVTGGGNTIIHGIQK